MITNVICSFTIGDQYDIQDCIKHFMGMVAGAFHVTELEGSGHNEVYYEANRRFSDWSHPGWTLPVFAEAEKISDNPVTIKYCLRPYFHDRSKDFIHTEVFNANNT